MRRGRRVTEKDDNPGHCRQAALRLLNHRWQGREELRRKLAMRGYSPEPVAETLDRLAGEGWLDDRRFALSLVRGCLQRRLGRARIERELDVLGVDAGVARDVLDELLEEVDEEARLEAICRKKMSFLSRGRKVEWGGESPQRKKLITFLLNQGYEYEAVSKIVARAARESEEESIHADDQ